ncbi:hypothetical protein ACVWW5_006774 [Bradyrhizobium sp. LM3.4]
MVRMKAGPPPWPCNSATYCDEGGSDAGVFTSTVWMRTGGRKPPGSASGRNI